MAHLLMVESWVGTMGTLLPQAILERGDTFTLVTRKLSHYLDGKSTSHPLLSAMNIVTAETNEPTSLERLAHRLHEVFAFDGVISSCDYYLPTVAAIAASLDLPGPRPDAVAAACRKSRTRAYCADAGVPQPAFAVVITVDEALEAAAQLGYPVVVKPDDLCGSMFVRLVESAAELRDAFADIAAFPVNSRGQQRSANVLIEEFVRGPEYSVEAVVAGGRTTVIGITDKQLVGDDVFIESGHMFPAALDAETAEAVTRLASHAINALGLDQTVAHVEVKLTETGPRLIEVNPRPGGNRITELVRHVSGIDLPAAYVDLTVGRTPQLEPSTTRIGSAAVAFAVPERSGTLTAVSIPTGWQHRDGVVDHEVPAPGRSVQRATNNNSYLGFVLVTHAQAGAAGALAQQHIDELTLAYADDEDRR